MQTSNTPMLLSKKAQEGVIEFQRQAFTAQNQQWNMREVMRQIDLTYAREKDQTIEQWRARTANSYGDSNRFQNVTMPVVMPQVKTAVAQQASVFLSGHPMFGVVASPQYIDEAVQMETVIEENSIHAGWVREFLLFFHDAFKYNLGAVEVPWDRETTASLETDVKFGNGLQGKPKEVIWEGQCVRRWDLYNTIWDSRVIPYDIPKKSEFVGNTVLMGRVALKDYFNTLPDAMVENIPAAFNSGIGGIEGGSSGGLESYYIPYINPMAMINKNTRASIDWMAWAGVTGAGNNSKIMYKNIYEVTTLYARIIPSDFGMIIPSRNTPQIWKFIIINHQVVVYAERQTNVHNMIPVLFAQADEDGLWYQTKSPAMNLTPIQDVESALMNSVIAARRRAIFDRNLYDPSRVNQAHMDSPNPSVNIPVRPSAYGKPVGEAVFQFPFRDDQSQFAMGMIASLEGVGDRISGFNKAQQGQFVKGNKTLHEYADVQEHAGNRDQVTSLGFEAQIFTPFKEIIKLNIMQYQKGASYYSRSKEQDVQIDPVALRNAVLNFKVSDGLVPSDKLINADVMQVAIQQLGSAPQIAAGYEIAPLFSYFMKTQGAHISDFEKSPAKQAYEQAMGAWQSQNQIVVEALAKAAKSPDDVKAIPELMKMLPPQPKPADYGYNPAQPAASPSTPAPTGASSATTAPQ